MGTAFIAVRGAFFGLSWFPLANAIWQIAFAFAWLEQIYVAGDRAMAVINALEHLEMAQNFVELAMPENEFVSKHGHAQHLNVELVQN